MPVGTNTFLMTILIAHLPLALLHFLFQKPPIPSPNSSMILLLLPFSLTTSITLTKPGDVVAKCHKVFTRAHYSENRQKYVLLY